MFMNFPSYGIMPQPGPIRGNGGFAVTPPNGPFPYQVGLPPGQQLNYTMPTGIKAGYNTSNWKYGPPTQLPTHTPWAPPQGWRQVGPGTNGQQLPPGWSQQLGKDGRMYWAPPVTTQQPPPQYSVF